MNRQLGCLVAMGLFALVALASMAGYGTSKNPRLRLKALVESAHPEVTFEAYETLPGESHTPWAKRLRVKVEPRPGAAAAPEPERIALTVVGLFNQPDPPIRNPGYTRIEIEVAGKPPAVSAFDFLTIERQWHRERLRLQPRPAIPTRTAR